LVQIQVASGRAERAVD